MAANRKPVAQKEVQNREEKLVVPDIIGTVAVPLLNIRKAASIEAEILGTISEGHEVKIINKKPKDFYEIEFGSLGTAFVAKEFITLK